MKNKTSHKLIFEGAEMVGKSFVISQIYNYLEKKYNSNTKILNGCHWFNCDVGVYGTDRGKLVINNYVKIFKELKDKNILVEKLHLADIIYNRLHQNKKVDYNTVEKQLKKLNFKIVLITFPEDEKILKERIKDRLAIYPHYERILQKPEWYINQQREYIKEIKKSKLEYLIIRTDKLPNNKLVVEILNFIKEK